MNKEEIVLIQKCINHLESVIKGLNTLISLSILEDNKIDDEEKEILRKNNE